MATEVGMSERGGFRFHIQACGAPFKDKKMFGEALEPLLVENKDKHKFLVSNKKDPPKKTPVLLSIRVLLERCLEMPQVQVGQR